MVLLSTKELNELSLESQQALESKKSTNTKKNEKKDANSSENKSEGMKKVRSYDVLKPEQLSINDFYKLI